MQSTMQRRELHDPMGRVILGDPVRPKCSVPGLVSHDIHRLLLSQTGGLKSYDPGTVPEGPL